MSLGATSPSPDPAAAGPAAAGPAASGSVEASGGVEAAALAGTVPVYADSIQMSARAAAVVAARFRVAMATKSVPSDATFSGL